MTTNKKTKGMNTLDLIFLVLLAAVVVFAAAFAAGVMNPSQKNQQIVDHIVYTVETTDQDFAILNFIEEGQTVYSSVSKKAIGTIAAIHETPTKVLAENHQNKTIDFAEKTNKTDILIEIAGSAQMAYPDVLVEDVALKVGKRLDYIVGDAALHGTIISIDYDETLFTKEADK